ncbi:MAG: LuxR family transcriptional regulator [Frankiales bacterium]|nr:LuxR family transcriptional regulator [Frankiales bacterium]
MPLDPPAVHRGRTQLDLVTAQLAAIDAWNDARRASEAAAESSTLTREMRLDLSRRTEASRREQQALQARTERQLREAGDVLPVRVPTRAVLAHRNAWLREGVAKRLDAHGVAVVGLFDDGAEAAGTVVAEQPDLVLLEDRLPTLSGIEVVRRVRTYAPEAIVGAQCLDGDGIRALVDAGAQAVFTRRIPPQDIADQLLECLLAGDRVPVAVN